jgi:hypothetical protein
MLAPSPAEVEPTPPAESEPIEPEPTESEPVDLRLVEPQPARTEPSGEPSSQPSTTEPDICRRARAGAQNPSYQNIGVVLAAQWDPRCRSVPWASYR